MTSFQSQNNIMNAYRSILAEKVTDRIEDCDDMTSDDWGYKQAVRRHRGEHPLMLEDYKAEQIAEARDTACKTAEALQEHRSDLRQWAEEILYTRGFRPAHNVSGVMGWESGRFDTVWRLKDVGEDLLIRLREDFRCLEFSSNVDKARYGYGRSYEVRRQSFANLVLKRMNKQRANFNADKAEEAREAAKTMEAAQYAATHGEQYESRGTFVYFNIESSVFGGGSKGFPVDTDEGTVNIRAVANYLHHRNVSPEIAQAIVALVAADKERREEPQPELMVLPS